MDGEVKYHLSRYLLGMILLERAHGLIAELRPTVVKRLKWRLKTFWCHISIPVSATAIFPNMVVKYRWRQKCVRLGCHAVELEGKSPGFLCHETCKRIKQTSQMFQMLSFSAHICTYKYVHIYTYMCFRRLEKDDMGAECCSEAGS